MLQRILGAIHTIRREFLISRIFPPVILDAVNFLSQLPSLQMHNPAGCGMIPLSLLGLVLGPLSYRYVIFFVVI